MPTLDWIGKNAVVKHHQDVPYRLLEPIPDLSHGDADSGNLIVQGDNLHALKALLPRYAGQVKCIYIDPPYNTGNEGWVYNDNVKSPEIVKWLNETVGREGEDLSRRDKWLCMMYPRLVMLKQLLRNDGAIFVSTDDNEVASLRFMLDEIFGSRNFITQIAWQKVYTIKNSARNFSEMHDHIVVYALNEPLWQCNLVPRAAKQDDAYSNPDGDSRGPWKATPLHARNEYRQGLYEIRSPSGQVFGPPSGTYWRYSERTFFELQREDRIWWGQRGESIPSLKRFLTDVKQGVTPATLWLHSEAGHNAEAKNEVRELLGELPSRTMTPKPTRLVSRIIQLATDKTSLVLDSFSGTGTTAHAVLKQNAEDGGNRKFILVEMEENIARTVTAERVRRVAEGYTTSKGKEVDGLAGGFQYCKLSEQPLFDSSGAVREDVTFRQLAEFVWFAETGSGFSGQVDSPLIGVDGDGRGIYLLYNGILKDKSLNGGNVLTGPVLAKLPTHDGSKVIYAAACRLGRKRLAAENIAFKQTPYALEY